MIAQVSISNLIGDPKKWLHSSVGRNNKKNQNITINNSDSETTPLGWEKKMMIYINNMIAQKITSNLISDPNKWSQSSVVRGESNMKNCNNQQR